MPLLPAAKAKRRRPPHGRRRAGAAPINRRADAAAQQYQQRECDDEARRTDVARRAASWNSETSTEREERLRHEERQTNRPANDRWPPKPEPPKADLEALNAALLNATSKADMFKALAGIEWAERHDGAVCPADRIPTEADLLSWVSGFGQIPTPTEPATLHPSQRLRKIRAQILGGLNTARHSHQSVGYAYGR